MIGFLLKGLLRDRSRSLFPVLMVGAGVFLTVFLYSWIQGVISDFLDTNARYDTGHVKIMTRAYRELADQIPNDLALMNVGRQLATLRKSAPDMRWIPRIRFGGLLDIPDERGETRVQGTVFGMGIDLRNPDSVERDLLNLELSIVRGSFPHEPNGILLSDELAHKLNVDVGDTATLLGTTANGAMALHNFTVSGTIRFGAAVLDRGALIADLHDVRVALDMPGGAGEILGFSPDMLYDHTRMTQLAGRLNARYAKQQDEFAPVVLTLAQQNGLDTYLNLGLAVAGTITLIFVGAMSVVLWNAGLINGIRRYGEIGVRLAMGEPKGTLYRRMIIESVAVGAVGSICGTLVGLAVSYYLQFKGIDIAAMTQKSTVLMNNVMRAKVTPTSYVVGFLPGLFASVLGTMFAGIGIYRRNTAQLFKELEV